MKQAGGAAIIESSLGSGTTVRLYLAIVGSGVEERHAEKHMSTSKPTKRFSNLVIDDDEGVRQFMTDSLELLGAAANRANR